MAITEERCARPAPVRPRRAGARIATSRRQRLHAALPRYLAAWASAAALALLAHAFAPATA